jgi:ATP-dependent Clp protease ATP-binding subunit ClpA
MFERFTTQARESVGRAQDEARALGHAYIGTEHLLLGIAAGEGAAAKVLRSHGITPDELRQRLLTLTGDDLDPAALATLGIDLDRVKEATEAHLGPGALDRKRPTVRGGHLPLTKRAKKVIELSLREALHLESGEIGTGHLLLGILRDAGDDNTGPGLAGRLLRDAELEVVTLRTEVTALIASRAA